jgi:hypothetical protein
MPMLDAYIPEGALPPEAEDTLLARLTDLLLQHEGVDPVNQAARALAWVFEHRTTVYVGGSAAAEPCYQFVFTDAETGPGRVGRCLLRTIPADHPVITRNGARADTPRRAGESRSSRGGDPGRCVSRRP